MTGSGVLHGSLHTRRCDLVVPLKGVGLPIAKRDCLTVF